METGKDLADIVNKVCLIPSTMKISQNCQYLTYSWKKCNKEIRQKWMNAKDHTKT